MGSRTSPYWVIAVHYMHYCLGWMHKSLGLTQPTWQGLPKPLADRAFCCAASPDKMIIATFRQLEPLRQTHYQHRVRVRDPAHQ